MSPTAAIPGGTVTLVFSDMEGSTRLLSRLGDRYVDALDAQRRILRETWAAFGGTELGTEGDSFYVVFPHAQRAVGAVEAGQRRLAEFEWPAGERVRVRMGLHTGSPIPHDGAYVGLDVHRAARIAAAAHGGQVTMSASTAGLVATALPPGSALRDLGTHRLKDLPRPEHIYQLDVDGLDCDFPPLRTLGASSTLPLADAPLLGRETEIDSLRALVADGARLVTLTGSGGAGKTSLGVELARILVAEFADGAYFVPLTTVTEAAGMWSSIAATLAATTDGDDAEAVIDFLADRHAVLVLDNLEQLADADTVVSRLLGSVGRVCLVATSRRPLHVVGEQEFGVPPLSMPADLSPEALAASPAVSMFVRHARRVRPDFSLTDATGPVVVAICRALDGLPLAIELAAARSKLLNPQAILARLGTALDIKAAEATRPERHRNLRATIDWSYRLLDPAHQAFFVRLGVFAYGADLVAVEAVCTDDERGDHDPLDLVLDIVDASLATVTDDVDGEPRVALLETVRAFALGELASTDPGHVTRDRHALHYLQVVRDNTALVPTASYAAARARLVAEHANICAALAWTLGGGPERRGTGLEIAASIGRHWNGCGRLADTEHWMARAVDAGAPAGPDLARCLAVLANCLRFRGKEPERVARLAIDSVDMLRRLGERASLPYSLRTLAAVEWERGNIPAAQTLYEEVMSLVRDLGDLPAIRVALIELGGFETAQGQLERALELESEAVAIAAELGDVIAVSDSRQNLACTLRLLGRVDEAELMMRQVIPVELAYGDGRSAVSVAEDYAAVLADLGHDQLVARLIGSADGRHDAEAVPRFETQYAEIAGAIDGARRRMSQAEWAALHRAGYDTPLEDELAHALTVMTEGSLRS